MPKVKNPLPEDKQSEKFEALVEKLKEDGHLAPEEADEALDKLVQNSPKNPR
jgi:polyhydroxyalkanoate synthesis regulator phasin